MRLAQLIFPVAWLVFSTAPSAMAAQTTSADQRKAVTIALGDRGELIVDGKRRFIRGGYRSGQQDQFDSALASAAEAGFNLVHDYRFEILDTTQGAQKYIDDARIYLRKADQLGLGVFLGLPRDAVRSGDEATLTKIVTELSGEHALWMWYLFDEPNPEKLSVESASRVYQLVHRLDPQRPSVMLTNHPGTAQQYSPYCDLLWVDRYPIAATSEKKSSLMPIVEGIQTARSTVPAGKAVWPVLQALDNKGNPSLRKKAPTLPRPNDQNHRPNEAELRAEAHIAIAQKSMALLYYWAPENWYSMRTDTPGVWQSLSRVVNELRELEPVLLSTEESPAVGVTGGDASVMTWNRVYQGRTYVGVVNADIHQPANVVLQVAGGSQSFKQLAGDASVKASSRGLDVKLGPAGVAVITVGGQ